MTDDITHDLDLLDDWLAGKGYGEEAGLVLRAMTLINAQARELRELRAEIAEVNRLYKYHVDLVSQGICEANELREENEKLRAALEPFADILEKHGGFEKLPIDVAIFYAAAAALKETGE